MEATMQGFYVNLPNTDVTFFKEFIRKMGWSISNYPIPEQVVQKDNRTLRWRRRLGDCQLSMNGMVSRIPTVHMLNLWQRHFLPFNSMLH